MNVASSITFRKMGASTGGLKGRSGARLEGGRGPHLQSQRPTPAV